MGHEGLMAGLNAINPYVLSPLQLDRMRFESISTLVANLKDQVKSFDIINEGIKKAHMLINSRMDFYTCACCGERDYLLSIPTSLVDNYTAPARHPEVVVTLFFVFRMNSAIFI